MTSYTIAGYYEDDGQAYCDQVLAHSVEDAARLAPDGCVIVSVFAGHHMDLLPAEYGVCGEGNQNGARDGLLF
ncbi:MAG: hypothetical protein L0228_07855 [Planctomycetes bacterium]|nr:hypothetical protein [Planctomycetota bacterium]